MAGDLSDVHLLPVQEAPGMFHPGPAQVRQGGDPVDPAEFGEKPGSGSARCPGQLIRIRRILKVPGQKMACMVHPVDIPGCWPFRPARCLWSEPA